MSGRRQGSYLPCHDIFLPMGLNIKNEAVCELARQAAQLTGKSQTSVIEAALRDYLRAFSQARKQQDQQQRVAELLSALDALREREPEVFEFGESYDSFLYDPATGMPA